MARAIGKFSFGGHMISGRRFVSYALIAIIAISTVACSKKLYTRMKRVAKVAAKPQETRPLPAPQPQESPKGTATPPVVEANPVNEPTREYLGQATLMDALKKDLEALNMNPDMNCFQYVFSNSIESIEISTGPCEDGKLAAWKDVKATIYFYNPQGYDPSGFAMYDMYTVDPKDKDVEQMNLGWLVEDPTNPGNALLAHLCTGEYAGDDMKKGCRLDIQDDGIIHGLLITTRNLSTPGGTAPEDWKPSNP